MVTKQKINKVTMFICPFHSMATLYIVVVSSAGHYARSIRNS